MCNGFSIYHFHLINSSVNSNQQTKLYDNGRLKSINLLYGIMGKYKLEPNGSKNTRPVIRWAKEHSFFTG